MPAAARVLGEVCGPWAASPQDMARLDQIDRQALRLPHERRKKMCEGMEPAVERGCGQVGLGLLLEESLDIAPGDRPGVLGARRAQQAQLPAIMLERVGRRVPPVPRRTAVAAGRRFHTDLPLRACRGVLGAMACAYGCFWVVA